MKLLSEKSFLYTLKFETVTSFCDVRLYLSFLCFRVHHLWVHNKQKDAALITDGGILVLFEINILTDGGILVLLAINILAES